MTRLLLLAIIAVAAPASAIAQGTVGVYMDATGTNCDIQDPFPNTLNVFVVHHTNGSTGVRFKLTQVDGANLLYLMHTPPEIWITDGTPEDGLTLCYDSCLDGPTPVTSILYFGFGTSAPCSGILVEAHPDATSGHVEEVDCDGNIVQASGVRSPINGGVMCPCFVATTPPASSERKTVLRNAGTFPVCSTVPTEQSTWGRIKELYTE